MWLLFLAIIGALAYFLFRRGGPASMETPRGGESALDILRERYAKGEITRDEFEQMRRDLGGQ